MVAWNNLRHSSSRSRNASAKLASEERFPHRWNFEHIEHPRRRRDRFSIKRLFDIQSHFGLRKVLLESLNPRDHPIAEFVLTLPASIHCYPRRRRRQPPPRQLPSVSRSA